MFAGFLRGDLLLTKAHAGHEIRGEVRLFVADLAAVLGRDDALRLLAFAGGLPGLGLGGRLGDTVGSFFYPGFGFRLDSGPALVSSLFAPRGRDPTVATEEYRRRGGRCWAGEIVGQHGLAKADE